MMTGFADHAFAAQFRDTIEQMVKAIIKTERPDIRLGKVYSVDANSRTAMVLFAGETVGNLVKVNYAENMQPVTTMDVNFASQGYDAPGDIVRIWGKPGNYFILDYFSGGPSSGLGKAATLNSIATANPVTANVPMNGFTFDGLADPTSGQQPATKSYVDTHSSSSAGSPVPTCTVSQITAQSIANNTVTTVTCPNVVIDNSAMSNGTGVTIKSPGIYTLVGTTAWTANTTGVRSTAIYVNGVEKAAARVGASSTGGTYGVTAQTTIYLNVGDQVTLQGQQTSGANLATLAASSEVYTGLTVVMESYSGTVDSGWVNMTLAQGTGTARYRQDGNRVFAEVTVSGASVASGTAGFVVTAANGIPAGLRPSNNSHYVAGNATGVTVCNGFFSTDGSIQVLAPTGGSTVTTFRFCDNWLIG